MGSAKASPNVDNYYVGKGILYIADFPGAGAPSWIDLGNCPRLEYEPTEQVIEHYSSRNKAREQDDETVIMSGYNLSFILDEISVKNMQLFMRASKVGTNILRANQSLAQRYALKFVSDNVRGPDIKFEFWKVKLTPNGAFSVLGDDYGTLSFNGKGLSDSANHSTSPFFTATFVTTTTSSTTTTTTTA